MAVGSKTVDYFFYVNGPAAIDVAAFDAASTAPAFQLTCNSSPDFQTGSVAVDLSGPLQSTPGSFQWNTTTAPAVDGDAVFDSITGNIDGGNLQDMMQTPSSIAPEFAVSYGFYDAGPPAGDLTTSDQIYAYLTPSVANWMGQLAAQSSQVRNAPFCRFALPGAHDAGTFDLSTVQSLLNDVRAVGALLDLLGSKLLGGLVDLIAAQALTAITNLAVTQKDDVSTMLDLGCRYFDFRPGYAPSEIRLFAPGIYHEHTVVPGCPFLTFLTDVLNWLAANPTEIVVVSANNQGFEQSGMTPPEATLAGILTQAQQATNSTIAIGTAGDLQTTYGDLIAANKRLFFLNQISGWLEAGKYDSYSDGAYATTNPQSILNALNTMSGGGEDGSSYTVLQLQGTATATGTDVVIAAALSPGHTSSPLMSTKPLFDSNTYPWLSANVAAKLSNDYLVVFLNDFIDNALAQRAIAITMQRMGISAGS